MKRFICLLTIILIFAIAVTVFTGPAIRWKAQKQLAGIFLEGKVSVEGSRFLPLRQISLFNIAITRAGAYDLRIAQVTADYSLSSLLRQEISQVTLTGVKIEADLPGKNISDLSEYIHLGPGGALAVKEFVLSDLALHVSTKDVKLDANVSAVLALEEGPSIRSIDLSVASLQGYGALLEDGTLRINTASGPDGFYVRTLQYNKVKIEDLNSSIRADNMDLFLDTFSAKAFGGQIRGNAALKMDQGASYLASLNFTDLDLEKFVSAFELEEKFRMSGLLGGRIVLEGRGTDIKILNGDLAMTGAGGTLVIKDPRVLEYIAGRSGQPLDILVESLKNYHYNKGTVALSLEEGNLLLIMALDGEVGKRNLNIVLHDFQLTKDGL